MVGDEFPDGIKVLVDAISTIRTADRFTDVLSLLLIVLIGYAIYHEDDWIIFQVLTLATSLVILFAGGKSGDRGNRSLKTFGRIYGLIKGYVEKGNNKEKDDTG